MRMSGCSCLTRRQFRRDPTDALFADQSQSILDNLVALLRHSRAWNCSAGNCGCTERDQQAQFRRERCSGRLGSAKQLSAGSQTEMASIKLPAAEPPMNGVPPYPKACEEHRVRGTG